LVFVYAIIIHSFVTKMSMWKIEDDMATCDVEEDVDVSF